MGLNRLRTALRSLRRHSSSSLINGVGLALAFACVTLIGIYLHHELTYDRFHPQSDRIVRVAGATDRHVEPLSFRNSQGILAPTLEETLPEVRHAIRVTPTQGVFRIGDRTFEEDDVIYADPAFFQVFDGFRILRGTPETALEAPGSLVLSASTAKRYFGDADPIGQVVDDRGTKLHVTAVMADVPPTSHVTFDAVIALETAEDPGWWYGNWFAFTFQTYALLDPGVTADELNAKLPDFIQNVAGAQMESAGEHIVLRAEPLGQVYLNQVGGGTGRRTQLALFAGIAAFVLLIAGLNYVNLSTAQSTERAREIGIRRTLGAERAGLAGQFLTESVVLSLLAFVVGLGLARTALPFFEQFTGATLSFSRMGMGYVGLAGLAALTGFGAGLYPSFVLTRRRPVDILRGMFSRSVEGATLRRGLVVLQLAITIGLISGTVVVYTQVQFMQTHNLGFNLGSPESTQLLAVDFGADERVQERLDGLTRRLRSIPGVTGVTASMSVPGQGRAMAGGSLQAPDGSPHDMSIEAYLTDTSFVDVYEMTILAGAAPRRPFLADSMAAYVMNERAIQEAGYASPQDALGAQAVFWGIEGRVVGVVKDFHTRGLQEPVEPLGIVAQPAWTSYLTLRMQTDRLPHALGDVKAIWADAVPERPLNYVFLDDAFARLYETEERFGTLAALLSGLAILIACMGLLGLALYSTQQRLKEISVRKVLGASTPSLVVLLTKDVIALVAVAFAAVSPLVYYGVSLWLDDFAYRTEVSLWAFLGAGFLTFVIAVATVTTQALRAAGTDPASILQKE